jgi:hypothetical protein
MRIHPRIKSFLKKYLTRLIILTIVVFVAYKAIVVGYNYLVGRYSCHSAWNESGMDYKYTLRGGCLLQKDNIWIPDRNLRM